MEEQINISPKKIFRALYKKWIFIAVCTAISLLAGGIKLYFSEPLYEAKASILINNKDDEKTKNTLDEAFSVGGVGDLKTEIEIIKSKKLIGAALKEVPFNISYIADGLFKKKEIYKKHSPFLVSEYSVIDKRIYGKLFKITPLDNKFYSLEIERSILSEIGLQKEIKYKGVYRFGDTIKNNLFTLKIISNNSNDIYVSNRYFFTFNKPSEAIVDEIASRLKVEQTSKEAYIIGISYKDTSPERAKEIVTYLANSSIKHNIDSKTAKATATIEFIKNQMTTIKNNLEESEKNLESFKKINNFMDIAVETEVSARKLSTYDQQLAQMYIEQKQIDRLSEILKRGDYGHLAVETVLTGLSDPLITKLLKSLSDAEAKKSALSVEYTDKHPELEQINNQIKKLKSDIAANIGTLKAGIHERKLSMESIIAKNEGLFKGLPQKEREYINLKREYLVNEKIYSYLLEKESEASILKASTVSNNSVLDNATASHTPVAPNVKQTLFIFAFLGLLVGVLTTIWIYFIDDFIEDKSDILKIIPVSIMYPIPQVKNISEAGFCNAFRSIRSHVLHMSDASSYKCISISSSFANNGKTTCVKNIASSLAFAGYKTIIVDLDFKESKLADKIEVQQECSLGVRNYLDRNTALGDIISRCNNDNLYMIGLGSGEYKKTKYMAPKKIFELIKDLKTEFDFIILNCPNTSSVADAFEYAKYADFSLFVFRAYATKKRSLDKILASLQLFEVNMAKIGIILNGIRPSDYGDGLGCEMHQKIKLPKLLS